MNSHKFPTGRSVILCLALILVNSLALSAKPRAHSNDSTSGGESENVFSLADFDPAADGVSDDGPAFQRALDAVVAAGGGTLFIPAGRYFIATAVVEDFSSINGASVTIQGVPSDTMPAAPTEDGDHLSRGLDLTSEIIPATGSFDSAFVLSNLSQLRVEHLSFTGRESITTDALITLFFLDVTKATIYHCEFYGISTFGAVPNGGGGNVVRAVRSDLSIEQSVFLGCTGNSGAYAPIVENLTWKGFSISNSIFLDYGQGSFFSKLGLGAPLSWINIGNAAPRTAESTRRQVVVRDTFLDEGGWVGITAYPQRWGWPIEPIDLIYISGLKMNVSNLGTAGHQFYNVDNVLIENSHYGWSHNSTAAIDVNQSHHVILDQLTCIDSADRIRADNLTNRLTIINSEFGGVDSSAAITNVVETAPEDDPVQYVRQQFLTLLGRQPDPASHFYWSDLLVRCGTDQQCLDVQHADLKKYLDQQPQADFSLSGVVNDEMGQPLSGVAINLTGSQSASAVTDEAGRFNFPDLATSGAYTVSASIRHYTFASESQAVQRPAGDVNLVFTARLDRFVISGRITKSDGSSASGVPVKLEESASTTTTTDANGMYSFANLAAAGDYTIVPTSDDSVFFPAETMISDLSADANVDFGTKLKPEILKIDNSDNALVLTAVRFVQPPFSIFDSAGFSTDGIRRMILFGKHLEGINDKDLYSVVATDDDGETYPLEVEFVGDVPGQSWLKQLNIKLAPALSGKCVNLTLSTAEISSNSARICLAE